MTKNEDMIQFGVKIKKRSKSKKQIFEKSKQREIRKIIDKYLSE